MIWIKAALLFGAIISSPFVFYFLWSFVAAGLVSARKEVRAHVPAGQPRAVRVRRGAGLFASCFRRCCSSSSASTSRWARRLRAADQRMAELRAAVAAGLRHQLSIAAGDAVPGADPRLQRAGLPGEVADRGAGDGRRRDGPLAGRRSLQHDVDARAAGWAVLRRHRAVQVAAVAIARATRPSEPAEKSNGESDWSEARSSSTGIAARSTPSRSLRRRVRRCGCGCSRPAAGRRSCRRRSRRSCRCGRP